MMMVEKRGETKLSPLAMKPTENLKMRSAPLHCLSLLQSMALNFAGLSEKPYETSAEGKKLEGITNLL